jgi:hypothetical protein
MGENGGMDERAERMAKNEALFRQVNERVQEIAESFSIVTGKDSPLEFVCECGQTGCTAQIRLTQTEYEAVRAESTHFAILPGHEAPEAELVVDEYERYVVVEKRPGEPAEIARETDPRD